MSFSELQNARCFSVLHEAYLLNVCFPPSVSCASVGSQLLPKAGVFVLLFSCTSSSSYKIDNVILFPSWPRIQQTKGTESGALEQRSRHFQHPPGSSGAVTDPGSEQQPAAPGSGDSLRSDWRSFTLSCALLNQNTVTVISSIVSDAALSIPLLLCLRLSSSCAPCASSCST